MLLQVSDEKEKVAQKEIQNTQFGEMKISWKRAIIIVVKEINTTEERPSLLLNKWQGSFRPRLNPVKLLTREREPRVISASRKQ